MVDGCKQLEVQSVIKMSSFLKKINLDFFGFLSIFFLPDFVMIFEDVKV